MNTLHTFGCSFTAPYTIDGRLGYRQYYNYKGQKFPKTWPEILSNDLNLNLKNYASIGSSNDEIFNVFCSNINNINPGDLVIIGWTYKERFLLANDTTNRFSRIGPNFRPKLTNVSDNTIDEILVNRQSHLWVDEIILWEILIYKTLGLMGVSLLTWSFDSTFPKNIYLLDELTSLGAQTINIETNGTIPDSHMGEIGHVVQAKYFQDKLTKIIKTHQII